MVCYFMQEFFSVVRPLSEDVAIFSVHACPHKAAGVSRIFMASSVYISAV
jgi:hypothetical protein